MKAFRWIAYAYLCGHAFVAIAQNSGESLVEKLSDLSELYENGLINEGEFLSAKNLLLSDGEITTTDSSDIVELSVNPDALLRSEKVTSENDNRTAGYGVVTMESRLKIHGSIEPGTKTLNTQLIVQGRLLKVDTLSTSERAATVTLGVVSSLALGTDLSAFAADALIDDENYRYLPMNKVVTEEVVRLAECSLVERNRQITSVHLVPSNSAYYSPNGSAGYSDIRDYWEDYIELNDSWEIGDGTDEVIMLFYNLYVADKFDETNINELPIIAASGFIMTISLEGGATVRETKSIHSNNLRSKKEVFGKFLNELVPQYQPELPHPDCGSKSEIYLKFQNEISEESELSDLESFFEDLGIRFERDRSKRSLLGVFRAEEKSDRVEYPVRIELFHTRRPRKFERASISYVID